MVAGKQRWEGRGNWRGWGTRYSLQGHAPNVPLPSARSCPLSLHYLTIEDELWTHQWINLLMRSAPSWSNYFPKPHLWTLLYWGWDPQYMSLWGTFQIQTIMIFNYILKPFNSFLFSFPNPLDRLTSFFIFYQCPSPQFLLYPFSAWQQE
jgi:hypothetical protein